jgi:hypothetical protein
MGFLDSIKKNVENTATETANQEQINGAYSFLNEGGVNTNTINVNLENNSFILTGTVDEGEQLTQLNEVITNANSETPVVNNVELKDWTADNVKMKVITKGSNLNVRGGASTDHEKVGKFANGIEVSIINKTQKDWYYVTDGETKGYCHTNYLELV